MTNEQKLTDLAGGGSGGPGKPLYTCNFCWSLHPVGTICPRLSKLPNYKDSAIFGKVSYGDIKILTKIESFVGRCTDKTFGTFDFDKFGGLVFKYMQSLGLKKFQ